VVPPLKHSRLVQVGLGRKADGETQNEHERGAGNNGVGDKSVHGRRWDCEGDADRERPTGDALVCRGEEEDSLSWKLYDAKVPVGEPGEDGACSHGRVSNSLLLLLLDHRDDALDHHDASVLHHLRHHHRGG